MFKVAVIAGTPVDTQMGVDYIEKKNCEFELPAAYPVYLPVSGSCDEQLIFQYSSDEDKRRRMDEIFDEAEAQGIRDFFIYCNSLSGAFDFEPYAAERGVRVYTPLQVYRDLGRSYSRVGVVAANNLSSYNIEKNLMAANDSIYVIGSGNMAMVHAIEEGIEPEKIVEDLGLAHMVSYMEACGCECLVLGCTHFPYLKQELAKHAGIPLIDPADEMFDRMISAAES